MPPVRSKTPSSARRPGPPTKPKPYYTPQINNNGNNKQKEAEKEPVEVYCRLRPINNITDVVCVTKFSDTIIRLLPPNGSRAEAFYTFKHVFPENVAQKELFDSVACPLVKDLIAGKNGLLFTYGITSSGKTYTITGTSQNCGILPRTLDVLFNSLGENQSRKHVFRPDGQNHFEIRSIPDALLEWQREKSAPKTPGTQFGGGRTPRVKRKENLENKEWEQREKDSNYMELTNKENGFSVFVSYVELYNNYIYDLLDESVMDTLKMPLKQPQSKFIREDSRHRVFVFGVTEVEVKSAEEAFEVFMKGVRRRRIAHTALNTESSRSHSVFNIRLVQAPLDSGGEVIQDDRFLAVSQLSLVDLAGSERTVRTQNTGERLREAGNINNSLMALRNCIEILRENQRSSANKIVPYRDNKLTHLFKSYFEGEGKIRMIICINPSADEYDETVHVMKFAETTQEVMVNRAREMSQPTRYNFRATALKYMEENGGIGFAPVGYFGPEFPTALMTDPNDESVIPAWLECLEERKKTRHIKMEQLQESQLVFREQVAGVERENMLLKQQVESMRRDLEGREHQVKSLENKCSQAERDSEVNGKKVGFLEKRVVSLERELEERDRRVSQTEVEKERLKQKHRDLVKAEKDRVRRMYERDMAEKESKLQREQCINQEKMHLVHDILCTDSTNWDLGDYREGLYPSTYGKAQALSSPALGARTGDFTTAAGSPRRIASNDNQAVPVQTLVLKRKSEVDLRMMGSPVTWTGSENTNAVIESNLPPVVNPRHRRSLSTGAEKWIDHRPPGTLDLGTVLQPKIKNKKSMSNLKHVGADDLRDAARYALTHHVADSNGEVETRVYKGEVLPSVGGGAQVIFSDVETLTQSSPPTGRKRAVSDSQATPHSSATPEEFRSPASKTFSKRTRH